MSRIGLPYDVEPVARLSSRQLIELPLSRNLSRHFIPLRTDPSEVMTARLYHLANFDHNKGRGLRWRSVERKPHIASSLVSKAKG